MFEQCIIKEKLNIVSAIFAVFYQDVWKFAIAQHARVTFVVKMIITFITNHDVLISASNSTLLGWSIMTCSRLVTLIQGDPTENRIKILFSCIASSFTNFFFLR